MINPVKELDGFVRATLVTPVERDHQQNNSAFHRRRVVAAVTFILGTLALGLSLRIPAGDPQFYWATLGLAAIWLLGALASGRLHIGEATTRAGGRARPVVQSVVLGLMLLGTFLAGSVVVAQIPPLREPVQELLNHARFGSLGLVFIITAINGVAEELFFRGALYAAVGRRRAVLLTTVLYTVTTAVSGIFLLAFAAAALGLITALQRRVTGGVLGPIITHLIWSLGMLLALPPLLNALA